MYTLLVLFAFFLGTSAGFAETTPPAANGGNAIATQEYLQLSLEELMNVEVYGASQHLQKVTEAPASVTIITADEIKKYGYQTLADILQNVKCFSNDLELLISGAFYDSQGHGRLFYKEYDDPATNNGVVRHADGDQSYHLFTKLMFHHVTLMGGFLSREKIAPTAHYGTFFPTDRTSDYDEHGYLDLKYEEEIANGWELVARLYYDRYYYRGNYLFINAATASPSKRGW